MAVTINVNNLSLCHKGSGGISRATVPDVCKTPPTPIPVPYPNISFSKDLVKGSTTVFADGGNSIAIKPSEFATSIGDEAGTAGGVASGVNMKESTWITYSCDVFIEGENACRLTDKKFQNHKNTVDMGGLVQPPLTPAQLREELCPIICACDGKGNQKCVEAAINAKHDPSTLAEYPYKISDGPPFMTPITSTTGRTTYPGGPPAPASFLTWVKEAANPKGSVTIVDVVKVSDPSQTATFDNVRNFVEIKFDDELTANQARAKDVLEKNGHGDKYVVIRKKDCDCPEPKKPQAPELDPRWTELLLFLLLLLLFRGKVPRLPGPEPVPVPGMANVPDFNVPGLEPAPGIADIPVLSPAYLG